MIYKFVISFAITLLASFQLSNLDLRLVSSLNPVFPAGIQGLILLLLRVSVGVLFILHGYPKITHLRQWAESLKMSIPLCFLSAASMLGG
jgi:putative oxidoreductase